MKEVTRKEMEQEIYLMRTALGIVDEVIKLERLGAVSQRHKLMMAKEVYRKLSKND